MLQVMLCAICMMSAALFYYDFVIIPRQNRELVEDLKSHFPEEFPPGGGSPTQKEEQAGRELEVPAVDFRSLQSQYPDVRGWLTIQESGIDYPVLQSSPEEPEYYLPRDYRGNYDINGSLFLQADCILGESRKVILLHVSWIFFVPAGSRADWSILVEMCRHLEQRRMEAAGAWQCRTHRIQISILGCFPYRIRR